MNKKNDYTSHDGGEPSNIGNRYALQGEQQCGIKGNGNSKRNAHGTICTTLQNGPLEKENAQMGNTNTLNQTGRGMKEK